MENIKIYYEYRYNDEGLLVYDNEYHQVLDISQIPKVENVYYSENKYKYAKLVDNNLIEYPKDELKILGYEPLEDGEYIEEGYLNKIAKPSEIHKWVLDKWVIDEEKFNQLKEEKYTYLRNCREEFYSKGFMFEDKYLIKSRTSDLTDTNVVFNKFLVYPNLTEIWYYSNGITEEVNKDRFLSIYIAMTNLKREGLAKENALRERVKNAKILKDLDDIKWL